MPDVTIAKIAVSGIPFRLDRPFDYAIPMDMKEKVQPGVRVEVPFTRANRRTEGIVLALAPIGAYEKLKPISEVLDEAPILTQAQIKLALWMHERFFCTVYEAVKAMLPAGLWFKNGKRRVSDKYVTMAALAVPAEEAAEAAEQKRRRAPQQSELLRTLCAIGRAAPTCASSRAPRCNPCARCATRASSALRTCSSTAARRPRRGKGSRSQS